MSTAIDDIKAQIQTIALTVTGIGNVYLSLPHVTKWDEVLEKFKSDDKLKVLLIQWTSRKPKYEDESGALDQDELKWTLNYIYSYQENVSEPAFDNLLLGLIAALEASATFSGKIISHTNITMNKSGEGYRMVCNVLCHFAELTFETIQ
jgi:hypothetical protein